MAAKGCVKDCTQMGAFPSAGGKRLLVQQHRLTSARNVKIEPCSNPSQHRKIPLRWVLIVPFLLEIFATVGLIGYLSFKNGQRAVDDLATQLRNEVSNRIDQHLQDYFDTSLLINQINSEAIQLELIYKLKVKQLVV